MSVPAVAMVAVHKSVPTLLVATCVSATLHMSWMEMDSLAMVKGSLFLCRVALTHVATRSVGTDLCTATTATGTLIDI